MKDTSNTLQTKIRLPLYVALALAIGLAACQPDGATSLWEEALIAPPGKTNLIGTPFAQAFAGMIVRSDRVVISEQSDPFDGTAGSKAPKPVAVYDERELSKGQKDMLLEAILSMEPAAHGAPSVALFKARHTIRFYQEGKLLSAMDLCFECGQIRWQGGLAAPYPDAMLPTLKKVLRNVGLTTDRDWDQHALSREKNLNK